MPTELEGIGDVEDEVNRGKVASLGLDDTNEGVCEKETNDEFAEETSSEELETEFEAEVVPNVDCSTEVSGEVYDRCNELDVRAVPVEVVAANDLLFIKSPPPVMRTAEPKLDFGIEADVVLVLRTIGT